MTPHRLTDTEFHATSSHSVGYGIYLWLHAIQNTDRFIRKRVRAKGTRPTADISVADRDQTRADALFCNRVSCGRDITYLFQPLEIILTPAPCARRTGRSRTASLCAKV